MKYPILLTLMSLAAAGYEAGINGAAEWLLSGALAVSLIVAMMAIARIS